MLHHLAVRPLAARNPHAVDAQVQYPPAVERDPRELGLDEGRIDAVSHDNPCLSVVPSVPTFHQRRRVLLPGSPCELLHDTHGASLCLFALFRQRETPFRTISRPFSKAVMFISII